MKVEIGGYLLAEKRDRKPGGRADRWFIWSKRGHCLGEIRWHGPWRQYAFFNIGDIILNGDCLKDLKNFLSQVMATWREGHTERTG